MPKYMIETKAKRLFIDQYGNKEYAFTIKELRSKVGMGARKAIAKLCKELGLFFFIQTDCRGLSLYLSREEMTDTYYNSKGFGAGF